MRAVSPSVIVKVRLTRLRSIGVTVVTTSTPYRLRLRYWRLSSCSARSASALSKRQALAEADLAQRLQQRILVELLHADKVDVGDDRAFVDHDDDDRCRQCRCARPLNRPVANSARSAAAPFSSL